MASMVPREEEYEATTGLMLSRCKAPGWLETALHPSHQPDHWP